MKKILILSIIPFAIAGCKKNTTEANKITTSNLTTSNKTTTNKQTTMNKTTATKTTTNRVTTEHKHSFGDWSVVTEATCARKGEEKRTCACGSEETRDIPMIDHDLVHHDAKTPTCTSVGNDEYDTCNNCEYSSYEEIAMLEHDYEWIVDEAATVLETGLKHEECKNCNDKKNENTIIPILDCEHDFVKTEKVDATCTALGMEEYYTCNVCHKTYSDIDGQLEVTDLATLKIAIKDHDLTHHDAKAATCLEAGYEAYDTCNNCEYTTYKEIAKLGHNLVEVAEVAATCTAAGVTAGHKCTRCDYTDGLEVIAKKDHDLVYHEATVTCTENGKASGYTCSNCDYIQGLYDVEAWGHNMKEVTEEEATCLYPGNTAGKFCTICDYRIGFEDIPALGHNYVDGVCSRCGNIKSAAVKDEETGFVYLLKDDHYSVVRYEGDENPHIVIPSVYNGLSVTEIETRAFMSSDATGVNYDYLRTITIPSTITIIGEYAFLYTTSLVEIYNLSSLNIEVGSGDYGYAGYYAIVIHTSADEPSAIVEQGDFIFCVTETEKVLIGYKGNSANVVIPDGTTKIGNSAISWNFDVKTITIPNGVTSIGISAFSGCFSLESINIPDGVKVIKESAFQYCNMSTIVIPDSVETIEYLAFAYCNNLTTVTFGSGVTSVGNGIFEWCRKITDIYYNGDEASWNNITNIENIFSGDSVNVTMHFNA